MDLQFDQTKLKEICRKNGVKFLGVFGSFVHGDAQPGSDVDMLVRFGPKGVKGLFGLIQMQYDLEEILGHKVDLVTEGFLSKYFRDDVISETKPIYVQT